MTFMLSANGFVQTLNAWNAPTCVLKAIGEFNKVDGFDTTAFAGIMDATTTKHYKMIDFDFKQKGVPNVTTALHNASKSGNFEVVNVLLDANADPNFCDILGNSPLMKASKMGHVQIVRKLLQKDADVNKEDIGGWTALFDACSEGNEDVVDVLLEGNADPNICDKVGQSPLIMASTGGNSQIVQKLLKNNADISKKDLIGQTALFRARIGGHDEVVAILENFIKNYDQARFQD